MKINERYSNAADAQQQLHNTYVELDGQLAHISYGEGWSWLVERPEESVGGRKKWGKPEMEDISELDLNLEPLKLGYMNLDGDAAFVQRRPLRKWKQGIYIEYLEVVKPEAEEAKRAMGIGDIIKQRAAGYPLQKQMPLQNLFRSDAIINAFDNKYPTFTRAYVDVRLMGKRASAWGREWAFRSEVGKGRHPMEPAIAIDYKGRKVGEVVDGKSVLYNRYKYLTETFVEAMIHAS
jgi:hypothetical protein